MYYIQVHRIDSSFLHVGIFRAYKLVFVPIAKVREKVGNLQNSNCRLKDIIFSLGNIVLL